MQFAAALLYVLSAAGSTVAVPTGTPPPTQGTPGRTPGQTPYQPISGYQAPPPNTIGNYFSPSPQPQPQPQPQQNQASRPASTTPGQPTAGTSTQTTLPFTSTTTRIANRQFSLYTGELGQNSWTYAGWEVSVTAGATTNDPRVVAENAYNAIKSQFFNGVVVCGALRVDGFAMITASKLRQKDNTKPANDVADRFHDMIDEYASDEYLPIWSSRIGSMTAVQSKDDVIHVEDVLYVIMRMVWAKSGRGPWNNRARPNMVGSVYGKYTATNAVGPKPPCSDEYARVDPSCQRAQNAVGVTYYPS